MSGGAGAATTASPRFANKEDMMDKSYPITVDYSKSLTEMVKAGKYYCANSGINDFHFPTQLTGKHKLKAEFVQYDCNISSKEVIADLDKRGFRPGTVHELAALGKKYPNEQAEGPIVALGSVWGRGSGIRWVACLYDGGSRRKLGLNSGDWSADHRFLAFRK